MATHIVLINYTDQGIRNVKQIPKRRKAAFAAAEKLGINVKETYMTMGAFDVVLVADAPSDKAMAAWSLSVGSKGNVRTQTMRAYSGGEMDEIFASIP